MGTEGEGGEVYLGALGGRTATEGVGDEKVIFLGTNLSLGEGESISCFLPCSLAFLTLTAWDFR